MPNKQINSVAKLGMNADLSPTELPIETLTMANNVAYKGTAAIRSGVSHPLPVVDFDLTDGNPMRLQRRSLPDEAEQLHWMTDTGFHYRTDGDTYVDVSRSGHVSSETSTRKSSDVLAMLPYFAAIDMTPVGFDSENDAYVNILDGSAHEDEQFAVVRGGQGRVWLANGQAGIFRYPQRVMWSDPVAPGALALGDDYWDTDGLDSTAGWVDLTDFDGEVLDMRILGNNMFAYGKRGIQRIWPTENSLVYNNENVAGADDGVLTWNCVVPVPKVGHFVVGQNTMYVFDGHQKVDVAVDRVEEFFRVHMVEGTRDKTFAFADYQRTEVWVCFVSNDTHALFDGTQYPNRALLWNYQDNTWSIIDIPNVAHIEYFGYAIGGVKWEDYESGDKEFITWDQIGGTWATSGGITHHFAMMASHPFDGVTGIAPVEGWVDKQIMVYRDFAFGDKGVYTARNAGRVFLERTGYAPQHMKAWTTKLLDWIAPVNDTNKESQLYISVGGAQYATGNYSWSEPVAFNSGSMAYINSRTTGRFLGWRLEVRGEDAMAISSLEIKVTELAQR